MYLHVIREDHPGEDGSIHKELKMSSMDEDQPDASRLQVVSDCFSRLNLLKEMNDRAFIGLRYHLFSPETFEQLIRQAGFTVLHTEVPPSLPVILHTVAQK